MEERRHLAKKLWHYHLLNHSIIPADCILALGSNDIRVAERAAELFLNGYAPIVVFSGGLGNFTKGNWQTAEADTFAKIARNMGVPHHKIFTENRSTNTGENIVFSYNLLKKHQMLPASMILVQKPFMERRTFATFKKQWPDPTTMFTVTSPQISFENYTNDSITETHLINAMIGDLQRIKVYPEKGFQVYQEIPDEVWQAMNALITLGYDQHLIHNSI